MVNQVELLQWYIMTRRNFSRKKKMRYLSLIDCVERPLIPNVSFDLARYTNANCEHEFRFDVAGIHELFSLLRIPDEVVTVYMARFTIAVLVFGSSRGRLSRIFLHMIDYVHDTFSDKLYMPTHIVAARINDYCAGRARECSSDILAREDPLWTVALYTGSRAYVVLLRGLQTRGGKARTCPGLSRRGGGELVALGSTGISPSGWMSCSITKLFPISSLHL
ncbi:hypothetical protein F441_07530 [Phytophthora nicotianae CJ01A1]|uniref:Uncharacterized protein n=1 Tax=Phytophthora nicotianae CJ01A1 TaxID=1317063 RepID=W2X8I3_PHYNI|nr:hypothetical protein F441_07530 [Phytophthora nicotianae CJ01A1]